LIDLEALKSIISTEFPDIVEHITIQEINEMRIWISDSSYVDLWFSLKLSGRYSYHWERRFLDDTLFRHDNIPHKKWEHSKTFPKHFHSGSQLNVVESNISSDVEEGILEFLMFVRSKLIPAK
jgi:uncharacterized protein DUF6516